MNRGPPFFFLSLSRMLPRSVSGFRAVAEVRFDGRGAAASVPSTGPTPPRERRVRRFDRTPARSGGSKTLSTAAARRVSSPPGSSPTPPVVGFVTETAAAAAPPRSAARRGDVPHGNPRCSRAHLVHASARGVRSLSLRLLVVKQFQVSQTAPRAASAARGCATTNSGSSRGQEPPQATSPGLKPGASVARLGRHGAPGKPRRRRKSGAKTRRAAPPPRKRRRGTDPGRVRARERKRARPSEPEPGTRHRVPPPTTPPPRLRRGHRRSNGRRGSAVRG